MLDSRYYTSLRRFRVTADTSLRDPGTRKRFAIVADPVPRRRNERSRSSETVGAGGKESRTQNAHTGTEETGERRQVRVAEDRSNFSTNALHRKPSHTRPVCLTPAVYFPRTRISLIHTSYDLVTRSPPGAHPVHRTYVYIRHCRATESSAEVRLSKWGHLFDIRSSTFYALTAVRGLAIDSGRSRRCTHNREAPSTRSRFIARETTLLSTPFTLDSLSLIL